MFISHPLTLDDHHDQPNLIIFHTFGRTQTNVCCRLKLARARPLFTRHMCRSALSTRGTSQSVLMRFHAASLSLSLSPPSLTTILATLRWSSEQHYMYREHLNRFICAPAFRKFYGRSRLLAWPAKVSENSRCRQGAHFKSTVWLGRRAAPCS